MDYELSLSRKNTVFRKVLRSLITSANKVAGRVRRKLMVRRNAGAKAGRFALKGKASSGRSQVRGGTGNGPVTRERIVESLRYLNEEAFRPRPKK